MAQFDIEYLGGGGGGHKSWRSEGPGGRMVLPVVSSGEGGTTWSVHSETRTSATMDTCMRAHTANTRGWISLPIGSGSQTL